MSSAMERIRWVVVIAAAGCLPVQAKQTKQAKLASAVREVHGVNCPAKRIEIDSERRFGGALVYVLDACGAKVEIEEGLEIPESFAELDLLSEEEMASLAGGLSKLYVRGTPASVQARVSAWCSEESARLEGESVAACQQRLPREVRPLGADIQEKRETEYWYAVGNRAFLARTGLYRPACNHLVLDDTPEACRCRGETGCAELDDKRQAAVRRAPKHDGRDDNEAASVVVPDGRSEFGISYLRTSVTGNETYRGAGFGFATFAGVRVARVFAVAGGVSLQLGLKRQPVEWQECSEFGFCSARTGSTDVSQVGLWVRGRMYPLPSLGLHLDAGAGGVHAWQRYPAPKPSDKGTGPGFLFGGGYELMMDERWMLGANVRHVLLTGAEVSGSATDFSFTLAVKGD
jgi:hypothetical protein